MTHTPAPELDEETIEAANARLVSILAKGDAEVEASLTSAPLRTGIDDGPPNSLKEDRKPRSDRGVKRGPKSPREPEVSALAPTTNFTITLTEVQYVDLEAEAARWMKSAGLDARYLTASPAEVLLNARVQKHWRTLIGK